MRFNPKRTSKPAESKQRPKPEALYRFIKTTPSSLMSNSPSKSLSPSPAHQNFPHREAALSSTQIGRFYRNQYTSSTSTRHSIPHKTPANEYSSSPAFKALHSASSPHSIFLPSQGPTQEQQVASKVTSLFDHKRPEAYPAASTSINIARTFAQSDFFKRHRANQTCKSTLDRSFDSSSKLKHQAPRSDLKVDHNADSHSKSKHGALSSDSSDPIRNSWYSLPGGEAVHPECFVCEGCNLEFEDGLYINFSGKFYHRKCTPEVKSSASISNPSNAYRCSKCAKAIGESWLKLADGSRYHLSCFTCALCYEEFEDGAFVTKDGAPYHLQCVQRPLCEACQEQINGPYVTRGPLTYHCGCFLCGICKKVIGAEMPFSETNH
ncbi:hypothetical protein K493DRAFT_406349, partial [Basidiobolus meristosporus CBS 931.73]